MEICGNGEDDDGNGKTDCADPACYNDPSCPACGDGFLDPREACDGADLAGSSCATLGFDGGGSLSCSASCQLVTTSCKRKENCDTPGDEDGNHKADCLDDACSSLPSCLQLSATMLPAATPVSTRVSITLRVLDGTNHFKNGAAVVVTAPEGAAVVNPVGTTGADGQVSFDLIMGRQSGAQEFQATVPGAGKSYPIELFATEVDAGTIVTVANATRSSGQDDAGPASLARLGAILDVQAASDGTLYLAEGCRVLTVSPVGTLAPLAGTGTCGPGPDAADSAAAVDLSVAGIALDETGHRLFVADPLGGRVRIVDLATGKLSTAAPGADSLEPNAVSYDGSVLHASDAKGNRVVRFDLDAGSISTEIASSSNPGQDCLGAVALQDCSEAPCRIAVSDGVAFVSGLICGTDVAASGSWATRVPGILRLDQGGVATRVAGTASGSATGLGVDHVFSGPVVSALDAAGNLFAFSGNTLSRIDGLTAQVTSVSSNPQAGFGGDGGPVLQAAFAGPSAMAFGPGGDLYVADTGNAAVRRIAGLGSSTQGTMKIAPGGGVGSATIGAMLPGGLTFKVTRGDGTPLQAAAHVKALDPGVTVYGSDAPPGPDGTGHRAVRMSLVPGAEVFEVSLRDLRGREAGKAITLTVQASEPAAGTQVVLVGADGVNAAAPLLKAGDTVPAPSSTILARGVAASSDGSLYLSAHCQVLRLEAAGTLEVVAGTDAACATNGGDDGGPALQAGLDPYGLALDDAKHVLYAFSYRSLDGAYLVRAIDLVAGTVRTVIGGGTVDPATGVKGTDAKSPYGTLLVDGQGRPTLMGYSGSFALDTATGLLVSILTGLTCPGGTPAGYIYSGTFDGDTVFVSLQCQSGYIVGRVEADSSITQLTDGYATTMTADPQHGLVFNRGGTSLYRWDPASNQVTPYLDLGGGYATALTYTASGKLVFGGYGPLTMVW